MSTQRVCDLDGRIIDPAEDDFYVVQDARTGASRDICMYCSRSSLGTTAWAASHAYPAGATVHPVAGAGDYIFWLADAGTSGGSEPTWPTTEADLFTTVADNTALWMMLPRFRNAVIVDEDKPGGTKFRTSLWGWMNDTDEAVDDVFVP